MKKLNKFLSWFSHTICPKIRWDEVVRIKAIGTDAIGPFAVSIIFTYSDGNKTTIHPEMRGYYNIIESLRKYFPAINTNWYEIMSKQPWHVESILYSKDGNYEV